MKNSDVKKKSVKAKVPKTKKVQKHKVVEEAIRQRAFEIFSVRGGAPGYELDDWLRAERELNANKP